MCGTGQEQEQKPTEANDVKSPQKAFTDQSLSERSPQCLKKPISAECVLRQTGEID